MKSDKIIPEIKSSDSIKTNPSKADAGGKKIFLIKRKIFVNITIFVIFIIIILSLYFHYEFTQKSNEDKFNQFTQYINDLKTNTASLETKITEGKKYKEIWKAAGEKKRSFDGIKIDEVNEKFRSLTEDYNISNPIINISVPEKLSDGIYDRKSSDVLLSSVTISFDAVDDTRAMSFIKEFVANLPGYIVVNNFYISKAKDYTDDDLIEISLGKFNNLAVTVKFGFSWYVLKKKG